VAADGTASPAAAEQRRSARSRPWGTGRCQQPIEAAAAQEKTLRRRCFWGGKNAEEQSMNNPAAKALPHKSYGTIAHLPGSRQGRDDVGIGPGQARICTLKARDKHDVVIVQEKLDGSNVAVANINGVIVPVGRKGYASISSPYEQHRLFAAWVFERAEVFSFLQPGERLCGEWLAQAHGTIYQLPHEPFVAFDLIRGQERVLFDELCERVAGRGIVLPALLSRGGPLAIEEALKKMGERGFHGATERPEGAVWRVERKGKVDFLAKFVRPDKVDGCYLPELSGKEPVWLWRPQKKA
jgi:hypothetical protein